MPFRAVLLALWALGAGPARHRESVERRVHVMGTVLTATVEDPGLGTARQAAEAAVSAVERQDRLLTTWDPAAPMGTLNAAPVGRPVAVDAAILPVLAEAQDWSRRTSRAFDPTVGALVDVWDLRGRGRIPGPEDLGEALGRCGPTAIAVDVQQATLTRYVEGAWMDTGAFGKGAALRVAADSLRTYGIRRALLDLGGQIFALASPGEIPWDVSVAHPSRRDEAVAMLRLAGVSAATSGNSERGLWVDGVQVGHILDPRTGAPAPWWGSVTVVTADPLVADVLSTALYVMGPEAGMAWARDLPDVGALFLVERDGKIQTLHNQAMARWLVAQHTSSPEGRIP